MLLQYFINYNLNEGWYVSVSPILIANWRASSGSVWTVPFGGGVGRIMKLRQPVNITAEFCGVQLGVRSAREMHFTETFLRAPIFR